ncbi:hypothetical protein Rhe02_69880 [Rhizocola hellebori]|uniref:VWFA domain-containing protein n=1 Tax=Rhizocola hellebori TaxID=1392758 RepID=A0A8J3VKB8_9ACTN|nr:hypothetical protein Rhe02_69880 [Rhizocola hellebori]
MAVLATPNMAAEPSLAVSGLREEAGLVEFYVSAQDPPASGKIEQITVSVEGRALEVKTERKSSNTNSNPGRAAVVVLDTSALMAGDPMAEVKTAAVAYLSQLPSDVTVAVVSAGQPPQVVQPLTNDRAIAIKKVKELTTAGETSVHDAILSATSMMAVGNWSQRRVVVLAGGEDTASDATDDVLTKSTRTANIPLDLIAYRTTEGVLAPLGALATQTGGRIYTTAAAPALNNIFAKAAESFSPLLLVQVSVPPEFSGKQSKLQIALGEMKTEVPVKFALDMRGGGPLPSRDAPPPSPTNLLLIGGLAFVALLVLGLSVVTPIFTRAEHRRRLAQVTHFTAPKPKRPSISDMDHTNQVAQAALAFSAQVVKSANAEGRITQQLDRAGIRLRPHEWVLLRAVVSLGLAVLLAILIHPIGGFVLGGVLGVAITSLYHRNRATKRANAFSELLPDALQLIIGSLRAGFSLHQAVDAMVRELPDPIATDFGRALGETRLGMDLEDALDRMAARVRNRDLSWAVVAIRVQQEVGGNLAEVLSNTVDTIRDRESVRRHVQALSAEGRLTAWVLLALPAIVGTLMFWFRGEYVRPLYTHPIGIMMSIVGVALVALGGFWLSRLVKVEV